MTDPSDPIAAVTHPDPYPWYGRLVAERPVYHDAGRGFWVVASTEAVTAVLTSIENLIPEVLRYDPPVQNTRRFVANDTTVAGQAMRAGDAILVALAAANRDPAANPNPDRFDIERQNRRSFTFGAGVHACPGSTLAVTIARAAVEQMLRVGILPHGPVSYRPSANGRIPVLNWNRSQER